MCFSTHHARLERRGDALIAREIFAHDRLLQPVGIGLVDMMARLDRGVGRPAHIDVDHDLDVVAQRLAHGMHVLHVLAPGPDVRHLHLDGLEPLAGELLRALDHAVAAETAPAA